jgi:thiosulfate/3-mercaptopyruvate sulfurtransferase
MGLLISAETLASNRRAMVFDCRSHLGNLGQGKQDFDAGHIPGAQHADLDQHLAGAPGAGGRHPLPEREVLTDQFQQWGIIPATRVICYDQNNGAFAVRLSWLCRWLDHDDVFVLDGGLDGWIQQGHPVSIAHRTYPQGHFASKSALTNICHVADLLRSSNTLLDARDSTWYSGEVKPIDPVACHIPGAISVTFSDNMSEGHFKPAAVLKQRFETLHLNRNLSLVCYCGSGVTATHNVLALFVAGYPEPALYLGSWSEWITNPDLPIETT